MLQVRARSFFFVASLTLAGACDDAASTATIRGFTEAYGTEECQQYFRCSDGFDDAEATRAQYSIADCIAANVETNPELDAQIDAGTVKYDEAAAKQCLASFSDLCIGGQDESCDRVLVGQVEGGGGCTSDRECVSDSCSANGLQCGTCDTLIADGAACGTPGTTCGPESYCLGGVCTNYIVDETYVVTQVGLGEACGVEFTPTGITATVCAPDLYCNEETGFCAERLAVGLQCDIDEDTCVSGAVCGELGLETRCLDAVLTRTVGADCGSTADMKYTLCDADARLYCDENGVCAALGGNGGVGSECYENTDCDNGKCAYETGECVAGDLANGASCFDDIECASGICMYSGVGGTCVDPLVCN